MKGLVAFSFALSDEEPNPCNQRLGRVVNDILAEECGNLFTVLQWEIALAIPNSAAKVVERHRNAGQYLDSEEVMDQAALIFRTLGIREVIVVAQPFLHLSKCRRLAREAGFVVVNRGIPWIGFDRKSRQWWTRGPIQLLIYAILQKAFGFRGKEVCRLSP